MGKHNKQTKILILDANQRSALAVTRSLGKSKNYFICTSDNSKKSLAGSSKYSKTYFQSPKLEIETNNFIDWITNLQKKENFDLIIPVTELSSNILLKHCSTLPLPFTDYDKLTTLSNKGNLTKLCQKLKIPLLLRVVSIS